MGDWPQQGDFLFEKHLHFQGSKFVKVFGGPRHLCKLHSCANYIADNLLTCTCFKVQKSEGRHPEGSTTIDGSIFLSCPVREFLPLYEGQVLQRLAQGNPEPRLDMTRVMSFLSPQKGEREDPKSWLQLGRFVGFPGPKTIIRAPIDTSLESWPLTRTTSSEMHGCSEPSFGLILWGSWKPCSSLGCPCYLVNGWNHPLYK